MTMIRKRVYYGILIIGVIFAGLLSREMSAWVPKWIGDILWGLMVFFIINFVFKRGSILTNTLCAFAFSVGVEAAKLYHTPVIDAFRCTILGGLLLGYVFSWENILCYLIGITIGSFGEKIWLNNEDNR